MLTFLARIAEFRTPFNLTKNFKILISRRFDILSSKTMYFCQIFLFVYVSNFNAFSIDEFSALFYKLCLPLRFLSIFDVVPNFNFFSENSTKICFFRCLTIMQWQLWLVVSLTLWVSSILRVKKIMIAWGHFRIHKQMSSWSVTL